MNNSTTIETIRQKHEEVYGKILREPSLAKSNTERDKFLEEQVYPLLNDMKDLSTAGISIEDYTWLSDTAIQWQVVFSSIFNIPRTVEIASPKQLTPSSGNLTSDMLDDLLKYESYMQSRSRMLEGLAEYIRHYRSAPAEMTRDWRYAQKAFVYWLLEGMINFAYQISSASFHYTEEIWMEELRQVTAYFHWVAEGRKLWTHDEDLRYACMHIREQLTNKDIKVECRDFTSVQDYIMTHYLTDGKLDMTKTTTVDLIERKAHRLWERTGEQDSNTNWHRAEDYSKEYYEHIIPAVMENDIDSIKYILNSFRPEPMPLYDSMTNCFEVLVAVYFLDADVLRKHFSEWVASVV